MDPNTIFDQGPTEDHPPLEASREWPGVKKSADCTEVRFPAEDGGKSLAEMAVRDLDGTLQLLAERAQYITQATGAAIALRDGDEMVCKASAGTSAPEVGARLQMESGLSGESIRTKQILRCDDAQTDGRVNRESCEALGIASVLVMPMIDGEEVLGVFELFSDHPHAFEERDIAALERMEFMVRTAIARAEACTDEKAGAVDEHQAEGTAGENGADLEDEKSIAEKFEGVAGLDSSSKVADKEKPVGAAQEPAIKDEVSLEMPSKKAADRPAFEVPKENVASTVHPPKIAFHIRGLLSKKTAATLETKTTPGAEVAAEATLPGSASTAEVERADGPVASATEPPKYPDLGNIENETSTSPELRLEATSAGASGAAVAPALAAADSTGSEEVSPGSKSGIAEVSPPPAPAEVAVAPVTLTFGTAIVPDTTKKPTEEIPEETKSPSSAPAGHTVKSTEEIPPPKTLVESEGVKSTSAPTARSLERSRSAVAGLRRCESCGFPVSEGRKLCLDCEKKKGAGTQTPVKAETKDDDAVKSALVSPAKTPTAERSAEKPAPSTLENTKPDSGPQFLVASPDHYESWIVQHMYVAVAGAVVIVGVIVYLLSR